jgi:zinc/manganese transport system permease protein/manganese/iron transport system permease protein
VIGVAAVFVGLVVSWHAATAAGATIAATAIAAAGVSGALRSVLSPLRRRVVSAVPVPV